MKVINIDDIKRLFDIYGDDWYIEGGIWELCTENENLKALKKLADKRKG